MWQKFKCYLGIHKPVLETFKGMFTGNVRQIVHCAHCNKIFVNITWDDKLNEIR